MQTYSATFEEKDKGPNPVDVHVGKRLRARRVMMGLSQGALAKSVGLTFQQVQKYERGLNRMGASRLFTLSKVLNVPVAYFFTGVEGDAPEDDGFAEDKRPMYSPGPRMGDESSPYDALADAAFDSRETLELIRAYYQIMDPVVRRRILDLAKSLSNTDK